MLQKPATLVLRTAEPGFLELSGHARHARKAGRGSKTGEDASMRLLRMLHNLPNELTKL